MIVTYPPQASVARQVAAFFAQAFHRNLHLGCGRGAIADDVEITRCPERTSAGSRGEVWDTLPPAHIYNGNQGGIATLCFGLYFCRVAVFAKGNGTDHSIDGDGFGILSHCLGILAVAFALGT
ncbi:MAG: hypothetical protein ABMA02_17310 [Saprospiraceae bacterium]